MSDPSAYVRTREKGTRDTRYPDAPAPLAVPVYDNHAHLEIEDGDDPLSLTDQLDRAAEVGVAGRRRHRVQPLVGLGGFVGSARPRGGRHPPQRGPAVSRCGTP